MLKLAVATMLLLAANVSASPGRPVSDLRFDGRSSVSNLAVASDGLDFMVLSGTGTSFGERTFTQKIADGHPVGPLRQIGIGKLGGLAWTGTEYLAASSYKKALSVVSVSREGSPTSTSRPPVVRGDKTMLAASRLGALAFGYTEDKITVQRLDLAGRPVGSAQTYAAPVGRAEMTAGPAAGGFGVVLSGYRGTWLMSFRPDGSAMHAPLILDGPYGSTGTDYHSNRAVVATNGSDTMVVFGAGAWEGASELKGAVVGPNGLLKSVRVIHSIEPGEAGSRTMTPVGLVWDGLQYIAAVTVIKSREQFDSALLRITRSGDRVGELTWINEDEVQQRAYALGWNGWELLLPMTDDTLGWPEYNAFCVSAHPVTLTAGAPIPLGRTLTAQTNLTIAAGPDGYLAAWFESSKNETTVRASRIDRGGNYLDGEGIVLAVVPWSARYEEATLAIDGNGPEWFVVWSSAYKISGRILSRTGTPASPVMLIGNGEEAAVRWNGTHYTVLYSDGSLNSNTVTVQGDVGETRTLAEYEEWYEGLGTYWIAYIEPSLVLMDGRLLAVFAEQQGACYIGTPGGCGEEATVQGMFLDADGADAAAPFTIAEPQFYWGDLTVAASANRTLVMWSGYEFLGGVFVSADAPEQRGTVFRVEEQGSQTSIAFDGTDFMGAWWMESDEQRTLVSGRILPDGTAQRTNEMVLDVLDVARKPVVAANATLPPLVGFVGQLFTYDHVSRAAILFVGESDDPAAVPPAPVITCATRNPDQTISVRWRPVADVLGISIELQLPDETFRAIGVASADAVSATVSTPDLDGSAVRIRTWNGEGVSEPSAIASSFPAPEAILQDTATACAGVPFTLSAALIGSAPFTVRWSDGVVQSDVNASSVSRQLTLDRDTTLSIVSVTDASCEAGNVPEAMSIRVVAAPVIETQPRTVNVAREQTATLNVVSSTNAVRYAWFEGARGDTSRPVGGNSSSFTTPGVTRTMQYWVRLTSDCGSVDSEGMTVALHGRRRAVR
jgi:hypothetical protein